MKEEVDEEEEEEEGRAEWVLHPEEDEVSTGEEAVREGVMEKKKRIEKRKSSQETTCNTDNGATNGGNDLKTKSDA